MQRESGYLGGMWLSFRRAKIVAMLDCSCGINIAVLKLEEYGFKVDSYFKALSGHYEDDDFDEKNLKARDDLYAKLKITKKMDKAYRHYEKHGFKK